MSQDTVVRPSADHAAYTIGDAISDNATATAAGAFAILTRGEPGCSGKFVSFTLYKTQPLATNAAFSLLIFDTQPAVAGFNDNAACAITDAEFLTCLGQVQFPSTGWTGAAAMAGNVQTVSKEVGFVCTSASSTLYGILIADAAYDPVASEEFTLTTMHVLD